MSQITGSLPLTRYRLSFRVTEPLHLPAYAGSTLRGAFGRALMQLSGIGKMDIEEKNPLFLQSPYAQIFDPQRMEDENAPLNGLQQLPVPYVIEAPLCGARVLQPDDTLVFHMVLCGPALEHLAIIILAWRRALLRGIGTGDGKGELILVEQEIAPLEWQTIYTEEHPVIQEHQPVISIPEYTQPQDVHLHLLTPLRLQHQGKILGPREINARQLLRQLIRRVSLNTQIYGGWEWPLEHIRHLNTLADQIQEDRRLHWQEWGRYSSRQQQAMKLGGVVGRWHLRQVPQALLRLLHLGQWLHVGKETAFGLGKYEWVKEPWHPLPPRLARQEENAHV
jgi:hypothetical protein